MFLNDPFPGAFGLDIGDLSIKLIQFIRHQPLGKQAFFKLANLRTVGLPPGCIVNGEIQQPEIVRKKIMHLVGADGKYKPIKAPWVVADLPESQSFLKMIHIDTPANDLLLDDIKYQASKHLPFELEESYFDWQVVPTEHPEENGKVSHVLVGAIPKVIADSYAHLLETAGLKPLALETETIAITRAMITEKKTYINEARAIIDLGATRSNLIIYDHNTIQFNSTLHFSGELVTTALSQGLKIDYAAAEKLKKENGVKYDKKHPSYIKIIDQLVDQLVAEIKKTIDFYNEHFENTNPITHITMCGGLADFVNLDNILSHKLRISAHPGNAWKNTNVTMPEEKFKQGPILASAIGLALRAAQNPLQQGLL